MREAPYKPLQRPMRYFVDEIFFRRQIYAVFLQDESDPRWIVLINVESPEEPVYCMSIWDLLSEYRFREVGVFPDTTYTPLRILLRL